MNHDFILSSVLWYSKLQILMKGYIYTNLNEWNLQSTYKYGCIKNHVSRNDRVYAENFKLQASNNVQLVLQTFLVESQRVCPPFVGHCRVYSDREAHPSAIHRAGHNR